MYHCVRSITFIGYGYDPLVIDRKNKVVGRFNDQVYMDMVILFWMWYNRLLYTYTFGLVLDINQRVLLYKRLFAIKYLHVFLFCCLYLCSNIHFCWLFVQFLAGHLIRCKFLSKIDSYSFGRLDKLDLVLQHLFVKHFTKVQLLLLLLHSKAWRECL